MRKAVIALALAFSLSGCALMQTLGTIQTIARDSITQDHLVEIERGMTVVFAGLNAYKRSCIKKLIAQNCRGNIQAVQLYTRRLPPLLARLRAFVRANDQINAISTYNLIVGLIADAKGEAAARGIAVGGM